MAVAFLTLNWVSKASLGRVRRPLSSSEPKRSVWVHASIRLRSDFSQYGIKYFCCIAIESAFHEFITFHTAAIDLTAGVFSSPFRGTYPSQWRLGDGDSGARARDSAA
jgi:hypothetical protein